MNLFESGEIMFEEAVWRCLERLFRFGEDFYYILYHNEYLHYGEPWPIDDASARTGPAEKEPLDGFAFRWVRRIPKWEETAASDSSVRRIS